MYCGVLSTERACQRHISFNFCLFINLAAMPTVDDWINNPLGVVDGLFGKTQWLKFLLFRVVCGQVNRVCDQHDFLRLFMKLIAQFSS